MITVPEYASSTNIALQKLQQDVYHFAQTHIAPIAHDMDVSNRFPRELWPQLGKLGLLCITIDKKYGGSDLGYFAQALTVETISRASGALCLSYVAHANLCANHIFRFGSNIQKNHYLPKLNSGEW